MNEALECSDCWYLRGHDIKDCDCVCHSAKQKQECDCGPNGFLHYKDCSVFKGYYKDADKQKQEKHRYGCGCYDCKVSRRGHEKVELLEEINIGGAEPVQQALINAVDKIIRYLDARKDT